MVSFFAYGNLYKTEELLPADNGVETIANPASSQSVANGAFEDTKGTAFDALDRVVDKYSLVAANKSTAPALSTETLTYDTSSYFSGAFYGMATESCNGAQPTECSWNNYDARGAVSNVHFNDAASPDRSATYDPDGRAISISSTTLGTQSYSYDADGRKVTEQEASGGGITSAAKFTHQYYADGMLKQLDVNSAALTRTGLFQYSYRADGRVQQETINDAAQANVGSTSLNLTYTSAGRASGRTEAGPGGNATPSSWTYDANGMLTSLNAAGSALNIVKYDPQGLILQGGGNFTYSVRGELRYAGYKANQNTALMANGTQVPLDSAGSSSLTLNSRSGAILESQTYDPDVTQQNDFTYDTAGRIINDTEATSSKVQTRTFDAENHTITSSHNSTMVGWSAGQTFASYVWGPTGHPMLIGSATGSSMPSQSAVKYDTLHWDGDQLIFTTNSSGQVDDIKVGTSGDITPLDSGYTGLTFWDRGPGGSIAFCHNATGSAGGGALSATQAKPSCNTYTNASGQTVSFPSSILWTSPSATTGAVVGVGQGYLLGMPRTDGFTDGLNIFQGGRTYDENSGQWTTPDAYAGNVHDPGSQKSYIWNGNNPISYSDPSGFSPSGTSLFYDASNPPDTGTPAFETVTEVQVGSGDDAFNFSVVSSIAGAYLQSSGSGGSTDERTPLMPNTTVVQEAHDAGKANPFTLEDFNVRGAGFKNWVAKTWAEVGTGGEFDVQRWSPSHEWFEKYRDASNFLVGVYLQATSIPRPGMYMAYHRVLEREGQMKLWDRDVRFADLGWNYGAAVWGY